MIERNVSKACCPQKHCVPMGPHALTGLKLMLDGFILSPARRRYIFVSMKFRQLITMLSAVIRIEIDENSAGTQQFCPGAIGSRLGSVQVRLRDITASKLPGAKLGASASITKNSAEMLRCRASSFALAIIAGVRSMPTTSCPSGESKKVKKPVPAPTSSTRNGLLSADSGSFGTISSSQRLAFGLSSSRKR